MKGLILSAGMGTRLQPLTRTQPKCLVHVAGKPMMGYQLDSLKRAGVAHCTIVVGHMADAVRGYFGSNYRGLNLSYVENTTYATTNNLFSLWLARGEFDDDILLLEADLVFDDSLVSELVSMDDRNVAVVDRFQPSMDGTLILAEGRTAKSMVLKADQGPGFNYEPALKTVNIYRLSRETLAEAIVPKMREFLEAGRDDLYYEAVFAELISTGHMNLAVMNTGNHRWAEIDTLGDLDCAERLFSVVSAAVS
jgi:choline kinase